MLQNKDHATDARGYPIAICGVEEQIQQALIRLTVRKGSFVLDPSLGSLLHTLGQAGEQALDGQAFQYVQQALLGMENIRVEQTSCTFDADAVLSIEITLHITADRLPDAPGGLYRTPTALQTVRHVCVRVFM